MSNNLRDTLLLWGIVIYRLGALGFAILAADHGLWAISAVSCISALLASYHNNG